MFKVGKKIKTKDGQTLIVARISRINGRAKKVAFVNVKSGEMLGRPTIVTNLRDISEMEIKKALGNHFEKILV